MTNDLWRDCASWLTRFKVLRPDHKANWPDANVTDLAYTLRDGVLLCNFLYNLDSKSIDMKDVNKKPQLSQFLCLRNIKTFLQACHEHYGLRESDLFEPLMLFDLNDFYRVLQTLSKLSNCHRIQKYKIPGFSVHKTRSLSQEDIYRNLSSNNGEEGACVMAQEFIDYDNHVRNEEIYQDLCSIDKKSTPLFTVQPPSFSQSLEKRDYVINELTETERNYVEVLNTLQKSFLKPLSGVLKEDDFKTIFGGIKELHEVHVGFLGQLELAVASGSGAKLSEVFLTWREKFLAYGDYCANLTRAQNRIQEVTSRNDAVNQEINRCQQEANNGKFKLRDILSVPMQRILKYHLLLEKLLKETLPNHEDYRGLERAREAMVDVAEYINEVKRDCDTLQIMSDIQNSISDWDLSDRINLKEYGRLIRDGELRIKAHGDQKVKVRYVFIFDKVMLMCKAVRVSCYWSEDKVTSQNAFQGDQYSYKGCLRLEEYKVEDTSSKKSLHRDTRWLYHWFLVERSANTAYTLYTRTEELKKKWIKAIKDALDNIEPHGHNNRDHKFTMHTFDKPTICMQCSKFLKGRIFQGYKCEKCQVPYHKACLMSSSKCGTRQPPELPPRPPITARPEIVAQPLVAQPEPSPPQDWSRTWTDHGALAEYLWFVGEMGREQASNLLERQEDGTYLLRIRPQGPTHPNETIYALSLKADEKVKHMKVYEKEVDGTPQFYLSESRFFRTLVDLIKCYEHTSLGENFIGLNVKLKWPFRRIVAIAEFDFKTAEVNQLPLKQGCQVIILSKEGDSKGWWKGQVQDRVGFFPKDYVREVSDNLQMDFH